MTSKASLIGVVATDYIDLRFGCDSFRSSHHRLNLGEQQPRFQLLGIFAGTPWHHGDPEP